MSSISVEKIYNILKKIIIVSKNIEIIQPDDWHVHFREGDMLEMVTNFSSRINKKMCGNAKYRNPNYRY